MEGIVAGPSGNLRFSVKHRSRWGYVVRVAVAILHRLKVRMTRSLSVLAEPAGTRTKYKIVVDAIVNGHVTTTSEGHLKLPDGIKWPIATNNILFVRRYYAPIFESVLNQCRPATNPVEHRFVFSGQPGIGKSVFGYVLHCQPSVRVTVRLVSLHPFFLLISQMVHHLQAVDG